MRYHRERVISGKGTGRGQFAEALRGLAIDADDQLYTVGDSDLKVFSLEGELLRSWRTDLPGHSVAVAPNGTVYVGQAGQIQLFDREGKPLGAWRDAERLGLVTSIGFAGDDVLVADTQARCIRRFDRSGKFLNDIGHDNRMRGFLLPNKHLDFVVDRQGVIQAANPGKHRVERYTTEGKLLGHFGRFDGVDPEGFPGCCNPTNLTLTAKGEMVVTEKAGPRVKVYDANRKLQAVMGESDFDPSCKNMDVAVDAKGRIYVIDTVRLHIAVYAPGKETAATQPTASAGESMKP